MAIIANPPCDEAAILAGPIAPPCTAGAWVLAATILGSSLAFIDGTVVNVGLPGATVFPPRKHIRRAMGGRIVCTFSRRAAPDRRLSRRSLQPSQGLRHWGRNIFDCVSVVRAGAGSKPIDRGSMFAGRGRSAPGPRKPGSDQCFFSARSTRTRDRHVVRLYRYHCGHRWCWEDGSFSTLLAVGLLYQLAHSLIVLALTIWRVPESPAKHGPRTLDWRGALLTTVALGGIVFAFIESAPIAGIAGFVSVSVRRSPSAIFRCHCSAPGISPEPI